MTFSVSRFDVQGIFATLHLKNRRLKIKREKKGKEEESALILQFCSFDL